MKRSRERVSIATMRLDSATPTLSDIFVENKDRIWAIGDNGVILVGNAEQGFRMFPSKATTKTCVRLLNSGIG